MLDAAVVDPAVEFFYFVDSTLYYGNATDSRFDSVRLSLSDFVSTGGFVYQKPTGRGSIAMMIGLFVVGSLGGMFVLYRKYKRKSKDTTGAKVNLPSLQNGNGHPKEVFDEIEKALIRAILKKANTGEATSISEINKMLGLSEKNEAIQKKNRSEVINGINGKWTTLYGKSAILIDRRRLNFDKRSFEYFITSSCLEEIFLHVSESDRIGG